MSARAGRSLGNGARVVVHAGAGVVHRGEDVLLVLPSVGPAQAEAARELLATCAVAPDPTGRRRARRVAALVGGVEDPDAVPDFVLLLDVEGGPALLAFGDVEALVRGRSEERVSGRESLAWVEHRVDPDFTELVLSGPGEAGPAAAGGQALPFDLGRGTVPGSGVVVLRGAGARAGAGAPETARTREATAGEPPVEEPAVAEPPVGAATPEAPEAEEVVAGAAGAEAAQAGTEAPVVEAPVVEAPVVEAPVVEVEPVTEPTPVTPPVAGPPQAGLEESREEGVEQPLDETARRDPSVAAQFTVMRPVTRFRKVDLAGAAPEARAPLPLAGETPDRAEAPTVDREVVVEGLACPAGHLNDPRATTCVLCGRPVDRDAPPLRAARPPLGVLVTDDGSVFLLTSDVVIGREPGLSEEVAAGRAQPLQLRDETHSVSRVHAQVRLTGWEVTVTDSGSSNGTFVSSSGAAGPWVPAEAPTPLSPGDRIRLGKRHLMFDRHPAASGAPRGAGH